MVVVDICHYRQFYRGGIPFYRTAYKFVESYSLFSEYISEPEVQVDGIHGECNGFEIFLKDVVQAPGQVGVYGKVLIGTP